MSQSLILCKEVAHDLLKIPILLFQGKDSLFHSSCLEVFRFFRSNRPPLPLSAFARAFVNLAIVHMSTDPKSFAILTLIRVIWRSTESSVNASPTALADRVPKITFTMVFFHVEQNVILQRIRESPAMSVA